MDSIKKVLVMKKLIIFGIEEKAELVDSNLKIHHIVGTLHE